MGIEKDIRFVPKKVDETWKTEVNKQPEKAGSATHKRVSTQDRSSSKSPKTSHFMNLVSSLGMQALIQMGAVEDPVAKSRVQDFEGAKVTIDMLVMLREKTVGNLDDQESAFLEDLIYDLQMKFVQHQNQTTR